jgi:hypothetical protein
MCFLAAYMSVVIEEAGEGNRIEVGETVTWICEPILTRTGFDPADPALRSIRFLRDISALHPTSCDTLKHCKFMFLFEYRCHANDPMQMFH